MNSALCHETVIKQRYDVWMEQEKILVVTLGGTIESFYDPENYTPQNVPLAGDPQHTIIPAALAKMGLAERCDFLPLGMRDSKFGTPEELDRLVAHLEAHPYPRVLVIEGTDRMAPHGVMLQQKLQEAGLARTQVVITGAMHPLRDAQKQWREPAQTVEKNDGWANLRMALHDLKRGIPDGVYLRMGRSFWPASRVTKEVQTETRGNISVVVQSGFRALAHPDSRGPAIKSR